MRRVSFGHTDSVDDTDFGASDGSGCGLHRFLEPRAARGIAAQEIKQINLNLGAEPRNSGSLGWLHKSVFHLKLSYSFLNTNYSNDTNKRATLGSAISGLCPKIFLIDF